MKKLMFLLSFAASFALAQNPNAVRYPITEAVVANFLRANGIGVTSSQVTLPMNLTAATREPQLEISATQRVADGEVRLELRCHRAGQCVAFDAVVHVADVKAIAAEVTPVRTSNQSGAELNLETTGPIAVRTNAEDLTSPHVRIGSPVVLVIEDGRMQIRLPAIAMDSVSRGGLVHVRTQDRRKIFQAVVVDSAVVKGAIE